jgi:dienelactone hydrolase
MPVAMRDSPSIDVDVDAPLLDERFDVRLSGFPPRRTVTVHARLALDGALWEGRAVVRTDDAGTADLDEQRPIAGTYDRADAMGLVWSAERVGDHPVCDGRTRTDGNVSLTATVDGQVVASATVERKFAADGVTRHAVRDEGLVARLYEPAGDGPHPGLVLLGGSGGGFPSRRAASLLASRGFAVLALAYFGTGDRPADIVGIPLGYVGRAVEWLADHDQVRPDPLGVVGWSRGGELALLAASQLDRLRTVVAYVPSTVVFQGNSVLDDPGSAWRVDGEVHPYVPLGRSRGFRTRLAVAWARSRPVSTRPLFERGLAQATAETVETATIEVEAVGGPILLITGDDDRVWPADALATRAMARLDAANYEYRSDHLHVPGAGHDLKVPYHPTTERAVRTMALPGRPLRLAMGGTPAGYARADASAWQRTIETLRAGLVDEGG